MKDKFTQYNSVELIKNGEEFIQKVLGMIQSARKCIFFHMYIFEYDQSSHEVINALIERSLNNVDVYLMIDGFGSKGFPNDIISKLNASYINFTFFSPVKLFSLNQIGRRLHQKVILIDADKALIGGTNISKEFIQPEELPPWLDYACIISGEEIKNLQKKIKRLYLKNFPAKKSSIDMLLNIPVKKNEQKIKLRVLENDYTRFKREVQNAYHKRINEAKKSIYITATYFLPGRKLLKLLRNASKRGVKVHLIFGDYSDIPSYNYGSMSLFPWYLKYQIKVYKWNKTIIHGKLAMIDDEFINIGSYNHNLVSQYANLEMNVEVYDNEFAKIVKKEINSILADSKEVDLKSYEELGFFSKLFNYSAYWFSSFFDFLQLFLIKK